MRTLIVPDIHENVGFWKLIPRLKEEHECSYVVFLGDYFDSWDGVTKATQETAEWLVENIGTPNTTFLIGNHDVQYAYKHLSKCSGYDSKRQTILNSIIPDAVWRRLSFAVMYDGVLLSHAGVHSKMIQPPQKADPTTIQEWIESETMEIKRKLVNKGTHRWLVAGRERGGIANFGGPLWIDWDTLEPPKTANISQVVGHTAGNTIRVNQGGKRSAVFVSGTKIPLERTCVCLDCNQTAYGILEAGVLETRYVETY